MHSGRQEDLAGRLGGHPGQRVPEATLAKTGCDYSVAQAIVLVVLPCPPSTHGSLCVSLRRIVKVSLSYNSPKTSRTVSLFIDT